MLHTIYSTTITMRYKYETFTHPFFITVFIQRIALIVLIFYTCEVTSPHVALTGVMGADTNLHKESV